MNGIIFVTLAAALLAAVSGAPGGHGYGHGGYALGYGFVASGHGHGHGHGHGNHGQGGVAKVQANQNSHAYNFGVNENGAHYSKQVYQTGNFHHAHAVPVAAYGHGYAGHGGHGVAHGHGAY